MFAQKKRQRTDALPEPVTSMPDLAAVKNVAIDSGKTDLAVLTMHQMHRMHFGRRQNLQGGLHAGIVPN